MSYQITNAVPEGDNVRVFVSFESGQENSHIFPASVTYLEIQAWCVERVAFFVNQAEAIAAAAAAAILAQAGE